MGCGGSKKDSVADPSSVAVTLEGSAKPVSSLEQARAAKRMEEASALAQQREQLMESEQAAKAEKLAAEKAAAEKLAAEKAAAEKLAAEKAAAEKAAAEKAAAETAAAETARWCSSFCRFSSLGSGWTWSFVLAT